MQTHHHHQPSYEHGEAGGHAEPGELQPLTGYPDGRRERGAAASQSLEPRGESVIPIIKQGSVLRLEASDANGWTIMRFVDFLPRWSRLMRGWFAGAKRKEAWLHALPCVVLAVVKTLMVVQISYIQRRFSSNLSEKNPDGFYSAAREFVGIILVAAPLFSLLSFSTSRLKLMWRKYMTEQLLAKYFKNEAYFRLKMDAGIVDNPDQRICDDIASFTSTSTVILMTLMDKVFTIIAVLNVLWSVSPELVLFVICYSLIGTLVTVTGFGTALMRLLNDALHCEGDMRFTLVRIAENAESIAFYGGAAREYALVLSRLKAVVRVMLKRLWWLMGLDFWTNCYSYATILVPSLMIGPRYFRGEVDFGTISQAGFLFNRLLDALSAVVDNLSSISALAAETDRLYMLTKQIDQVPVRLDHIIHKRSQNVQGLRLQDLSIVTPRNSLPLSDRLSLEVAPGESLLIMGPSGCGKSSLLRAVSGLWSDGSGIIETPDLQDLFFLPQKPYMPLGTLRQQLLFPSGFGDFAEVTNSRVGCKKQLQSQPEEAELMQLLTDVRLGHIPAREGGLDVEQDWAGTLSQGEQQRVAFLRLLLHCPGVAFLDEATSAVDNEIEGQLYTLLQRCCRCYISIGHRMQLLAYHTHVLYNVGPGQWELMTSKSFKSRYPGGSAQHPA